MVFSSNILNGIICLLLFRVISIFSCNKTSPIDIRTEDQTVEILSSQPFELDLHDVMFQCNESYKITPDEINHFNSTGKLPDESAKVPTCYIRCFFERSGMVTNGIINRDLIEKYLWPATGDSVQVCQREGKNITNPCTIVYEMASCLMLRAIVDARNMPKI